MATQSLAPTVSSRFAYTGDDADDVVSSSNLATTEAEDNAPSSSSIVTGIERQQEQQSRDSNIPFVTHKVDKLDTLAGLAIKYGVSVSDIKLVNGLLSDQAMFARDTLLIPTEALPIGLEYSAWAAMIITRHGRVANGTSRPPKSLLSIEDPDGKNEAIAQLRRHYNMGSDKSLNTRGGHNGFSSGYDAAGDSEVALANGWSDGNGSLELSNLRTQYGGDASQQVTIVLKDNGGAADERVRRRRATEGPSWTEQAVRMLPTFPNGTGRSVSTGRAATMASGGNPREGFLQKLKKVASNPALGASAQQLTSAAEGVFSSISENVRPGLKTLKNMLTNKPAPNPLRTNAKRD